MRILTQALKEEHRQVGLYLEEDDHILKLKRGQQTLAKFSAIGVTIEELHKEADHYLSEEVAI